MFQIVDFPVHLNSDLVSSLLVLFAAGKVHGSNDNWNDWTLSFEIKFHLFKENWNVGKMIWKWIGQKDYKCWQTKVIIIE